MSKFLLGLLCLLLVCKNANAEALDVKNKGKELYLSYGCALCHGWKGAGDGINAQRFRPPPTNFHILQAYMHGSDRDSIRRSVQYGIKEDNSTMPAFEDIPSEEVDQIINYLQSLQKDNNS